MIIMVKFIFCLMRMTSKQNEIARRNVDQRMSIPGDGGRSDIKGKISKAIKNSVR